MSSGVRPCSDHPGRTPFEDVLFDVYIREQMNGDWGGIAEIHIIGVPTDLSAADAHNHKNHSDEFVVIPTYTNLSPDSVESLIMHYS